MALASKFLRLLDDQGGNALAIGAAVMPLLIGAAAIGVDTIQSSLARRQLQRSADSAALAGAYALVQSEIVRDSAEHDLALNNRISLAAPPLVENAPTAGPYAGNGRAVRVRLDALRSVPFISFFTGSAMPVSAEATAAVVYAGEFCMIALEEGDVTGITFSGSANVDLGCGVASNSRAANAVSADGSSRVVASPVAAVGGVPSSGSYEGPTTLLPYSPPQPNPFADLPVPSPPNPCGGGPLRVQPNDTRTVSPGCYSGMDIKGTVTFQPGVYYIDGSSLSFGATARASGSGVTFILTSRNAGSNPSTIATLDMHGNAQVNFSAPTSGTYEGVLMYQDPRANYGDSHVNGNSSSRLEGGFYFPRQQLTFNGTTGMRTECIQLVARRLRFTGNASVQNTCPENGADSFDATFVRLVG